MFPAYQQHTRDWTLVLWKLGKYHRSTFFVALTWFVLLTAAIQYCFGIYYETNDDVGMMMLAQGFGLTDKPSELLLYSNRIQGLVVSSLGWPLGLPGYSLYLFACLLVSLAAIVAAMTRFNKAFFLNLLVVSVLALRPIFAPQFTIIAALLMLAGVLALERYRSGDGNAQLVAAGAFAVLAFLMRPEAMLMVALLSLPLVLRISLLTQRAVLVAGALTGAVVLAATWWDVAGYRTADWAAYNAMDLPRAWFTDFANTSLVLKRPHLLAAVGWSANDVRMLASGWWLDPDVYSPGKLKQVIDDVGLMAMLTHDQSRSALWVRTFMMPDMLPGTTLALATLLFLPRAWRWRIAGLVVTFLVVTLLFTLAGRFDVSRIFYPGAVIVSVIAVAVCRSHRIIHLTVGAVAIVAALLSAGHHVAVADSRRVAQGRAGHALLSARPDSVVFEWAGALPYEALYPAFIRRDQKPVLDIYSLGADQLAPYALSRWGGDVRNALARFSVPEGVQMIASEEQIDLLRTYCYEHWDGRLIVHSIIQIGTGHLYHAACRSIPNIKDQL
jgi:hypothetical protein